MRDTLFAMGDVFQRVALEGLESAWVSSLDLPEGMMAYLTPKEAAILAGFKSRKRRTAFLAGRILAKQCVLARVDPTGADGLGLADIEIVRHGDGRPRVTLPGRADPGVLVSISHGGKFAVAATVLNGGIGVDVEPVTEKAFRLRDRIASISERNLMFTDSGKVADRYVSATRLFSAKEAMAKCLGTHLFHALHYYRLVAVENKTLSFRDDGDNSIYRVSTTVYNRHVFSLLRTEA